MYIIVYVCANGLSLGQRSVMNKWYTIGDSSYISKYYIEWNKGLTKSKYIDTPLKYRGRVELN